MSSRTASRTLDLPSISVLIPTFNSERTLSECLASIRNQDYPPDRIEVIVADAGSTDATLTVAAEFGAHIVDNPLQTAEAGKAAALRHARHDLVALIDSDNILPTSDWLQRMVAPLIEDQATFGAEPWAYSCRPHDPAMVRYAAMLGMADPMCHFVGNYDRLNTLTGSWTSLPLDCEDRGDYILLQLRGTPLPTIGANGTVLRRCVVAPWMSEDYFYDVDVIQAIVRQERTSFAKVKIGIIHLSSGNLGAFERKQRRRARDYFYFRKQGRRTYRWWNPRSGVGAAAFALAGLTIIPLIAQAIVGLRRTRDTAWLLHPAACQLTLGVYVIEAARSVLVSAPLSRRNWRQ